MKVLIADDDAVALVKVRALILRWGYSVDTVTDGVAAWDYLRDSSAPTVAVIDWQMPGMDGDEVCRKVLTELHDKAIHIILVTAVRKEQVIDALNAGAADFLVKPFDMGELQARLRVGRRVVQLQDQLRRRVKELEAAMHEISQLQLLLPICSYCKKIRDDNNYWQHVETYISSHTGSQFSHGICPECLEQNFPNS